jgi:hypothetical protein
MSRRLILVCHVTRGDMADDSTVALLQEIRDLQKKHTELLQAFVEGQQQGLKNQQQSLAVQQQVVERQKLVLARSTKLWVFVFAGVFLLLLLAFTPIVLNLFMKLLGH